MGEEGRREENKRIEKIRAREKGRRLGDVIKVGWERTTRLSGEKNNNEIVKLNILLHKLTTSQTNQVQLGKLIFNRCCIVYIKKVEPAFTSQSFPSIKHEALNLLHYIHKSEQQQKRNAKTCLKYLLK